MLKHLIEVAKQYAKPTTFNGYIETGYVASALETEDGEIYSGISIDSACSLGFCAEHAAIADMLKNGKSVIKAIVAVDASGCIVPPCGRCRELLSQLSDKNQSTVVAVNEYTQVTLAELMPYDWKATRC
ncbi:cytidine deaminase family protein [Providencia huaxiensis]|uniref:cytidine deaminase family protein n=1 Tax=Providencia huaxiensis TaxID=2027290 RepID=UPI0032DB59BD